MKKFVLMVAMVVSCVCMAQNSHAQTGRDGNTDIDMLSMKNFYAIDIVDVDLAASRKRFTTLMKIKLDQRGVYKSNGSGSPIQYKRLSRDETGSAESGCRFRRKRPCTRKSCRGRRISGGS
ncbi:MAG: hypothetical protein ACLR6J_15260 [Parabacteroides merdae]